jgi:hypothetical protein
LVTHAWAQARGTAQHTCPHAQKARCWLPAQVKAKDVKLKQLRGAIQALEEKLAQLLKDKVDM